MKLSMMVLLLAASTAAKAARHHHHHQVQVCDPGDNRFSGCEGSEDCIGE